jgi:hypothetical protein
MRGRRAFGELEWSPGDEIWRVGGGPALSASCAKPLQSSSGRSASGRQRGGVCTVFAWDLHDRQAPEQLSRGPLHGRFVCLAVVLSSVLTTQKRQAFWKKHQWERRFRSTLAARDVL